MKSGVDDLRQDAVMQQFFSFLNRLLTHNALARTRSLHINQYRVVPFSPASGVLAWIDGAESLADYLVGPFKRGGVYARHPAALTFEKSFSQMQTATSLGGRDRLLNTFEWVLSKFEPRLQYYFLERYASPAEWFQAQLAYTRSVAAASMAGYIIGLGDRHCSNILLMQGSGEVLHIDLGIAFEQGRLLATPELVPFRLTPNIVAAMGAQGIGGAMTRCSEIVFEVRVFSVVRIRRYVRP